MKRLALAAALLAVLAASFVVPAACGSNNDGPGEGTADAASTDAPRTVDSGAIVDADAGRDGPSAKTLFLDDSQWAAVSGIACFEATGARERLPKRVWTACGAGCREAPAPLQFAETFRVNYATSAGQWSAGETYLLLDQQAAEGTVAHLTRLSDDETLAAVLSRKPLETCYLPWWGGSSPTLFMMALGDLATVRYGRAPKDLGKSIAWHATNLDDPGGQERFILDDGYGMGTGGGAVLAVGSSATAYATFDGGGERAHGFGNQLVWGNSRSKSIRSWSAATGDVDLVTMPQGRHPLVVRLSEERLVWLSGVFDLDYYQDVRWEWSPRSATSAGITVNDGPALPIKGGVVDLQIAGEWAAVNGCSESVQKDPTSCRVYVWNMTSGMTWTIPGRSATQRFNRVLALSPTELVLGETGYAQPDAFDIKTLVRVDLSTLSGTIANWGP